MTKHRDGHRTDGGNSNAQGPTETKTSMYCACNKYQYVPHAASELGVMDILSAESLQLALAFRGAEGNDWLDCWGSHIHPCCTLL